MAAGFRSEFDERRVTIRFFKKTLLGREKAIPFTGWRASGADAAALRAIDSLVEQDRAEAGPESVLLLSREASSLPGEIAERLEFPKLADIGLAVSLEGHIERPEGRLRLRWTDRHARPVMPRRIGMAVMIGERRWRLAAPVLALVEAAETFNATAGSDTETRIAGWMPVQAALQAVSSDVVPRDGYLDTFTLFQAAALALEMHEGDAFTPRLMSRPAATSLEDDAPAEDIAPDIGGDLAPAAISAAAQPLLSGEDERAFAAAFASAEAAKSAYKVGRNRFVLIDPSLKTALDVVRRKQSAPTEERRAFVRNPRAAIAAALVADGSGTASADLFVETAGYSERVEGLGLWEKPKIPWLKQAPNGWLPESGWTLDGSPVDPPPLPRAEVEELNREYERAEARGDPSMVIRGRTVPLDAAMTIIEEERARTEAAEAMATPPLDGTGAGLNDEDRQRIVLVIKKTNLEAVDYTLTLDPRRARIAIAPHEASMGVDPLKPHQTEGFRWLVEAWRAGWPGVLLADDMGLGKTFQALAFMAWLKENAARSGKTVSILVVAPTALLRNWEKEAKDRLVPGALGPLMQAYGSGLRTIKLAAGQGQDEGETLDRTKLREAGWTLTTYETLTDHERVFARIDYDLVVFDEMQKVKAPDTLNTKAAKAINARFVLGLTGTPIENRMADLWCIFDRLTPGYLGDLKGFSSKYRDDAAESLVALKARLDEPVTGDPPVRPAPPVMKRRMKADILEGLPKKLEQTYCDPMPPDQARAYRELVAEAMHTSERDPGFMLKVLHAMRGLSLHPDDATDVDVHSPARFETFAAKSARLKRLVDILRSISSRGEKALIFIEFIGMQRAVADGLHALFDLKHPPGVINGGIPGEKRLDIVERFSQRGPGFDVLVLSPRAAGIGLNITAANHVIHLSRWWNPAVEDQCNDRAYRIGQTKPVTVHIPIATHPDFPDASFDERLHILLARKRELSRTMLAPPTSEADVGDLFKATVGTSAARQ